MKYEDYKTQKLNSLVLRNPESFSEYEWEFLARNNITNGYGPRNAPLLRRLLKWLAPMFRESNADIHDMNFIKGGTEEDKLKADQGFFIRLVHDSLQSYSHSIYYLTMSICFYIAVRLRGYKYFKYKNYAGEHHKSIQRS